MYIYNIYIIMIYDYLYIHTCRVIYAWICHRHLLPARAQAASDTEARIADDRLDEAGRSDPSHRPGHPFGARPKAPASAVSIPSLLGLMIHE